MASSDDEHSQQKREREVLGDEIERMRELLGKDFPNSDEESSGEEDSEEEANDEFIERSSYSFQRQNSGRTTQKIHQDSDQHTTRNVYLENDRNKDAFQEPQFVVCTQETANHVAGHTFTNSATNLAPLCYESTDSSEPYMLTELKPANPQCQESSEQHSFLQLMSPRNTDNVTTSAEQSLVHCFETTATDVPVEPSYVNEVEAWEEISDLEKALRLNRQYQLVIRDELKRVELALMKNREHRISIGESRSRRPRTRKEARARKHDPRAESQSLSKFAAPYFKDDAGNGPPDNEDARLRRQMSHISAYQLPARTWSQSERDLLAEGVRLQNYEHKLSPLMQRLRELKDVLSIAKSDKAEIMQLERDIALVKETPKKDLEMELDGIDWDKLSTTLLPKRSAFECQLQWCHVGHPRVNLKSWTKEEDKRLIQLAQRFNNREWNLVAERLQTNRTAFQCLQRFQKSLNRNFLKSKWTPEEDERLKEVVRVCGEGDWQRAAEFVEGRTGDQCLHRFQKTLRSDIKKGRWSQEEDEFLLKAVEKHPARNWHKLAELVPGRTGVQCRERYVNVLDPSIKKGKGSWTPKDDEKFLKLVKKHGEGNWAKIARDLGNRTDNQCWRRWMVLRRMDYINYRVNTLRKKKALVSNFSGRRHDRPTITVKDLDIPDIPVEKPLIGRPPRVKNRYSAEQLKSAPSPSMAQNVSTDSCSTRPSRTATIEKLNVNRIGKSTEIHACDNGPTTSPTPIPTATPTATPKGKKGQRAAAVKAIKRLAAVGESTEPGNKRSRGTSTSTDIAMETDIDHVEESEDGAHVRRSPREKSPSRTRSSNRRKKQGAPRERVQRSHHRTLMNKWQLEKRNVIMQMQRKSLCSSTNKEPGGDVKVSDNLAPFSLLLQAFRVNVPLVMQALQKTQAKAGVKHGQAGAQSLGGVRKLQQPLTEHHEPAQLSTSQQSVVENSAPALPTGQRSSVQTNEPTLSKSQQYSTESSEPRLLTSQDSSAKTDKSASPAGQQSSARFVDPIVSTGQQLQAGGPSNSTCKDRNSRRTEYVQQRVNSLIEKNNQVLRKSQVSQGKRKSAAEGGNDGKDTGAQPCIPCLPPCHSTLRGLHTLLTLKPQLQELAKSWQGAAALEQEQGNPVTTQGARCNDENPARTSGVCHESSARDPADQTANNNTLQETRAYQEIYLRHCLHRNSEPFKLLAERFRSLFMWPTLLGKVPLTGAVPRNFLKKPKAAPGESRGVVKRLRRPDRLASNPSDTTAAQNVIMTSLNNASSSRRKNRKSVGSNPTATMTASDLNCFAAGTESEPVREREAEAPYYSSPHNVLTQSESLVSEKPAKPASHACSEKASNPSLLTDFDKDGSAGVSDPKINQSYSSHDSITDYNLTKENEIRASETAIMAPSGDSTGGRFNLVRSSTEEHVVNMAIVAPSGGFYERVSGKDFREENNREEETSLFEEQVNEKGHDSSSVPFELPDSAQQDCDDTVGDGDQTSVNLASNLSTEQGLNCEQTSRRKSDADKCRAKESCCVSNVSEESEEFKCSREKDSTKDADIVRAVSSAETSDSRENSGSPMESLDQQYSFSGSAGSTSQRTTYVKNSGVCGQRVTFTETAQPALCEEPAGSTGQQMTHKKAANLAGQQVIGGQVVINREPAAGQRTFCEDNAQSAVQGVTCETAGLAGQQVRSEETVPVPNTSKEPAVTVCSAGQQSVSNDNHSAGAQDSSKRRAPGPNSAAENEQSGGGQVTSHRRKRKYLPFIPAKRETGLPRQ